MGENSAEERVMLDEEKPDRTVFVVVEGILLAVLVLVLVFKVVGIVNGFGFGKRMRAALDDFYADRMEDALVNLDMAMKSSGDYTVAHEVAAFIHLYDGKLGEAREVYQAAADKAGDDGSPIGRMGLLIVEAMEKASKGQTGALGALAAKVEGMKGPRLFEEDVCINAAAMYATAGDRSAAERVLGRLKGKKMKIARWGIPVWLNARGMIADLAGKDEEAIEFFRRASLLSGKWTAPRVNLSAKMIRTFADPSTPPETMGKMFPALDRMNTNGFPKKGAYLFHNTLGVLSYMKLGSKYYPSALKHLDKAVAVSPNVSTAKMNRVLVMALQARATGGAKKTWAEIDRRARELLKEKGLSVDEKVLLLNVRGCVAAYGGDLEGALGHVRSAYSLGKKDALTTRNMGIVYYRLHDYRNAKRFMEESVGLRKQEDLEAVLSVLRRAPEVKEQSVRYTSDHRPVVGFKVAVRSCRKSLGDCAVAVSFGKVPGSFSVVDDYLLCVPTRRLDTGKYELRVRIEDPAGNVTDGRFPLSVDDAPPSAEILQPTAGKPVKHPRPVIVLRLKDALSAVDLGSVRVKYMTAPGSIALISEDVVVGGRYRYDMPSLKIKKGTMIAGETIKFVPKNDIVAGRYKLLVELADILGNKATLRLDFEVK